VAVAVLVADSAVRVVSAGSAVGTTVGSGAATGSSVAEGSSVAAGASAIAGDSVAACGAGVTSSTGAVAATVSSLLPAQPWRRKTIISITTATSTSVRLLLDLLFSIMGFLLYSIGMLLYYHILYRLSSTRIWNFVIFVI
jgi:hypothetical protein